nr:MAG TPA: hypothetical protein [Caudoviricetes sp.]
MKELCTSFLFSTGWGIIALATNREEREHDSPHSAVPYLRGQRNQSA